MSNLESIPNPSSKTEVVPHTFRNGMYSTTNYEDTQENLDRYLVDMKTYESDEFEDDEYDEASDAEPEQPISEKLVQTEGITLMGILNASIALKSRESLRWKKTDFNLADVLNNFSGPFIEIAGPTEEPYEILKDVIFLNQ